MCVCLVCNASIQEIFKILNSSPHLSIIPASTTETESRLKRAAMLITTRWQYFRRRFTSISCFFFSPLRVRFIKV